MNAHTGSFTDLQLLQLQRLCNGTPRRIQEGGRDYILLPGLRFAGASGSRACDALLETNHRNGTYPTRLYLAAKLQPLTKQTPNWHDETFVEARMWYSCSWKDVTREQPLVAIVTAHMEAFE